MARSVTSAFALLALILGGCIDRAPGYEASLLTYDEGLLGKWNLLAGQERDATGTPRRIPVEITPSTQSVTKGRLGKYNKSSSASEKEKTVPAYSISLTAEADDPEKKDETKVFTYDGILIKVDGETFLAYQPAEDRKVEGEYMDYLPVHRLALLKRDGDEVTLRFMKSQIVWVPTLKSIDEPSGEAKLPTEEGQYLVTDADRLVKLLSLALKSPGAWGDAVRVVRVK
jgi:hypothetical protein